MSPLADLSPYENYPPRWNVFDSAIRIFPPDDFGFVVPTAEINRFAARYRAAKCFRSVTFEGLTTTTADGYTALCQILLVYSAFEHFLKCLGIEHHNSSSLLTSVERAGVQRHLRTLNGQSELFLVIRPYLNSQHKSHIDNHVTGRRCNPFYLASSIRHAFVHGRLTALPMNVPPTAVATVSRYLCRMLMKVMEREFERRMIEFEEGLLPNEN